jgi:hypothetical protein
MGEHGQTRPLRARLLRLVIGVSMSALVAAGVLVMLVFVLPLVGLDYRGSVVFWLLIAPLIGSVLVSAALFVYHWSRGESYLAVHRRVADATTEELLRRRGRSSNME